MHLGISINPLSRLVDVAHHGHFCIVRYSLMSMERPARAHDSVGPEQAREAKQQEECCKKSPEGEARPISPPKLQEKRRMQVFF